MTVGDGLGAGTQAVCVLAEGLQVLLPGRPGAARLPPLTEWVTADSWPLPPASAAGPEGAGMPPMPAMPVQAIASTPAAVAAAATLGTAGRTKRRSRSRLHARAMAPRRTGSSMNRQDSAASTTVAVTCAAARGRFSGAWAGDVSTMTG